MKIPKSFNLFATTINVEFDSETLSYNSTLGDCSFCDNKINLSYSYKGNPIPESTIVDTFYHERTHVILDAMGRHELSQDEEFVEVFSRLLRQADETAEFDKRE
ncbi:hypothetical protein Phi18:3_gp068 [Cellulophaga phage phi18:3]|uniref:Uncharacterized protein n=1 Tax=Cellulophaga phage phi18:3 TaxID=1327983 RepID=S0A1B7_9CAUD|nr:hypothetical protein Phi18:3_gp068 [Cellulophaga phage phi18:3]AGO48580.1 hypothetical protein Phi18:3_gp068 [Cellulophaga phage phi18:3]